MLIKATDNKFPHGSLMGSAVSVLEMHDGKSVTYHHAIMRHAGEALKVRQQYETLTPVEKEQFQSFLNSL